MKRYKTNHCKALRGKIIRKNPISLNPFDDGPDCLFEFFLNNSEIEKQEILFSEKASIVVILRCDETISLSQELKQISKQLKPLILNLFISNQFLEDDCLEEVSHKILELFKERKGIEVCSLAINDPSYYISSSIHQIPNSKFYYGINCSYKIKDEVPFTYVAEKIKEFDDFCVEINQAYNNRFMGFDETPDALFFHIWNRKDTTVCSNETCLYHKDKSFEKILNDFQDFSFDFIRFHYRDAESISE